MGNVSQVMERERVLYSPMVGQLCERRTQQRNNGACQCFYPLREFPPIPLKLFYLIVPYVTQVLLELLPLHWSSEGMSLCANTLRIISVHTALPFWDVIPVVQSQRLWGLVLLAQMSWAQEHSVHTLWGSYTLLLRGTFIAKLSILFIIPIP